MHLKHYSNAESVLWGGWEICWCPGYHHWGFDRMELEEGTSRVHYILSTPLGSLDWKRVKK